MQTKDLVQLGDALRRARVARSLSVRALATTSGLIGSTISRLETGKIESPRPDHLRRLATALAVDVEDFYALAGYLMPEGLPELRPYLRAKYGLGDRAASQIDEYFQALRDQWVAQAPKEANHDRGDHHN